MQTSERGPNERRDKIVHFWQMRFFFARWPPLLPRWSLAAWKHVRLSFQKKRYTRSGSHVLLLQVGFLRLPSLTSQAFSKLRHDELALGIGDNLDKKWAMRALGVYCRQWIKHKTCRSLSYTTIHQPSSNLLIVVLLFLIWILDPDGFDWKRPLCSLCGKVSKVKTLPSKHASPTERNLSLPPIPMSVHRWVKRPAHDVCLCVFLSVCVSVWSPLHLFE